MGGQSSSNIKIASLNYAGISHSPFEFYSGTKEQRQEMYIISKVFQELVQKEQKIDSIPQNFKWGIKNIDKIMQRERYCPLYRRDAGVIHGRLLTRQKFQKKWTDEFNKNSHYVNFPFQPSADQIKRCRTYDFLVFKALIEYVYNYKMGYNQGVRLQDRDPDDELRMSKDTRLKRKEVVVAYEAFLDDHFSKEYLNHSTKLKAVKSLTARKDVVFLQDASDELINSIKNQGLINVSSYPCRDCVVLLKQNRSKFINLYDQKKILQSFSNSQEARLKQLLSPDSFSYDKKKHTASVSFVDNFLFISIHFSRPKEGDWPVANRFMQHLLDLRIQFPSIHIIVGGDCNRVIHEIPSDQLTKHFFKEFRVYPPAQDLSQVTTHKKRTWLQSQRDKADEDDKMTRDFLFTDLQLQDCQIELLGGKGKGDHSELLTTQHPFDHYVVSGTVVLNRK